MRYMAGNLDRWEGMRCLRRDYSRLAPTPTKAKPGSSRISCKRSNRERRYFTGMLALSLTLIPRPGPNWLPSTLQI